MTTTGTTTTALARAAMTAIGNAIVVSADAIRTTTHRLLRTGHAIFTVTRRHVPAWMAGVLTVCLFIPGPLDELLVLIVIAVMAAFKPEMRADFARTVPHAWKGDGR